MFFIKLLTLNKVNVIPPAMRVWAFIPMILVFFALPAQTQQVHRTHVGKLELSLLLTDVEGKTEVLVTKTAELSYDFVSKKCEIKIDALYGPCIFDMDTDLKNAMGELLVKGMPEVHFAGVALDKMIMLLGKSKDTTRFVTNEMVKTTSSERQAGFTLPFYTCGSCDQAASQQVIVGAFGKGTNDFVERDLPIQGYQLDGKKLALRLRVHDMATTIVSQL